MKPRASGCGDCVYYNAHYTKVDGKFIEVFCESDRPLHAETHTVTICKNDGNTCFGTLHHGSETQKGEKDE